jgi:AraC-like DNA-binding protein
MVGLFICEKTGRAILNKGREAAMKRVPMTLQLSVILFCIMAVPIAILTWYSSEQILENSEQTIVKTALAELNTNQMLMERSMNYLSNHTVALTSTNTFDRIQQLLSFAELNSNLTHVMNARIVQRELMQLKRQDNSVYSAFFYLNDADYVISTDKGVTKLDNYESIDWMEGALEERRGIRGVWYARKLDSGVHVLSYILPLNKLSTNTNGTIVVNLLESEFESYFHTSDIGKQEAMVIHSNGTILSHSDKRFLLEEGMKQPILKEIFESNANEGYVLKEVDGERTLYTWTQSKKTGWVNVGVYAMEEFMETAQMLQRNIVVLTMFIVLAGIILTIILAIWLSKPARKLVQHLSSKTNLKIKGKNELAFLDQAFQAMQEKEESLHYMLRIHERDSHSLAIHHLLRGESSLHVKHIFSKACFLVAVVSIDQYTNYVSKYNTETRDYHRFIFHLHCEDLFPENVIARCVYQGDGCFAIIINYEHREEKSDSDLHKTFKKIRNNAEELLKHSVTIGVSSPAVKMEMVSSRFAEAMEVIKYRMIKGSGGITYWDKKADHEQKYIYPSNSERRILNFIDNGDLASIVKELKVISEEIRSAAYVSYDNILFIYYHLVGSCIKHVRESNVSIAKIYTGNGNIYTVLSSIDTLEELENYLFTFFEDMIQHLKKPTDRTNDYRERILNYLDEHYCKEIDFQEMAAEIGISYSYMRRIVYEETGQSLIDHLNKRRIERAKQMLVETNLTIGEIAFEIGYKNAQSFNRFFRKFEGMTPSHYKQMRL